MQKRILSIAVTAILIFSFFNWSCAKLDTTDIGSDLLPAVDNVHTFADTLFINSTQGFFSDSTYIGKSDDFALGAINNDPLFGKTNAYIFMQLKPAFYPYYLGNPGDTLMQLDSIVLCLKYKGFWGDSSIPVHLEVKEVNDPKFRDSVDKENPTNYQPTYSGASIGSTDVDVRRLGDTVKFTNKRDYSINQIRIKLDATWAAQLYGRDSIASNGLNNAFYSDSFYRRFYNGLAVIANGTGSNGLMYVNLADTATKIEIHYKRRNQGKVDSVYSSLRLSLFSDSAAGKRVSNAADNIIRNRAGAKILSPNSDENFLQTAPGTFVNLNIPALAGLSNRIIHRAEIIVEQIPTDIILDEKLSAPNFLYLELKDTGSTNKWKPVYFDLNTQRAYDPDYKSGLPYWPGEIDYQYFGGYRRSKTDAFGNLIKYYNFNISRYVQQIVTKRTYNYDLRMYAPFNLSYPQYSPTLIPFSNNIAFGRVRIGSGSNPNYKLRLRIVYSKL